MKEMPSKMNIICVPLFDFSASEKFCCYSNSFRELDWILMKIRSIAPNRKYLKLSSAENTKVKRVGNVFFHACENDSFKNPEFTD